MSENRKVPAIRFAGFTAAWEQRKLGDIVDVRSGRDYKHLSEGSIPVYGTGGYMLSVNEALSYDEDAIGIGRKGTIDNPYVLKAPFWTVDTLFYAVPRKNVDLDFTFCIFQNVDWKKKDESTGVPSLSKTAINSIDIVTPPFKEQWIIGSFFCYLDNLITLHLRKYEKLLNAKKFFLEKMFPRNGAAVPEIRFSGFTSAWEQRKFSDVVETRRGLTYKPSAICEKGIRVLRSSNIEEDRFVLKDDDVFVDEKAVNIAYAKQEDILITAANGSLRLVGKHTIISQVSNNSTVHGGFMLLGSTKEPYFINASMGSTWYRKFIDLFVSGGNGAIGNLNKNDLDNQDIQVPDDYEQKKIGIFFKSLDSLITLHQRKLEALKNVKKAMLEKMFV